MIYIILNCLLLATLIYLAYYLDTKIKGDNFEVSSFAISLLFACVEEGFFILTMILSRVWVNSISTQLMRIVFCFDAVFFVQMSFGFTTLASKKYKGLKNLVKLILIIIAVFIIYKHFNSVELTIEKGVIIESEYIFSPEARKFFPLTWVSLYIALYRYILPVVGYVSLLILQEDKATQIERYQSLLLGLGIFIMWIINYAISFISVVSPSFTLLYMFAYLFMIITLFAAWTKSSVPSGKNVLINVLKVILSLIVPAMLVGVLVYFAQPVMNNFKNTFVISFVIVSAILIVYSITISEVLNSSSKFITSDYEVSLEKDLANIDYTHGEMDQIANRTFEIMKRNVDASSMNVYILTSGSEFEIAFSSTGQTGKYAGPTNLFENLLNVNRSVVVSSEVEKEHDLASVLTELNELFKITDSDILFVLNEGHNVFGFITFGKKNSGDHFKTSDREIFVKLYSYFFVFGYFMRNISNKDVIGVVNREIKMSSQIITSIQENIDKINNEKCDVGYLMTPAHNIGGEFIDFIRLTDSRHLIVVGDLSGKGIAASMNMVILKSIIRTYLAETHDFKQLVVKVNSFIRDSLRKGTIFAGTFALIDFETDTLYYINCGIPALMLYTQVYNNVIEIQGSGHILGFVKDISPYISVKSTKLNRGDIIVACTDGLIQSHSLRGEQFGKERVQQAILDNSTYPAQRMAQFTFDGLLKFMSKEMEDDVSILVLKYGNNKEVSDENEIVAEETVVEEAASDFDSEISETDIQEEPASVENAESEFSETEGEEPVVSNEIPVEPVSEKSVVEDQKKPDDMGLPEGFEMPDLSDLDSLLSEAGL